MRKQSKRYSFVFGQNIQILRKRPMCWLAIGFLLIISMFLVGRSYKEVLNKEDLGQVYLEGKIVDKQYKESSYGGYWQITLKNVKVSLSLEEGNTANSSLHDMAQEYEKSERKDGSVQKRKSKTEEPIRRPEDKGSEEKVQKLEGKYLCQVQTSEALACELKVGQQILLYGKYVSWEEPSNPGQFNLAKYYCSLGILGQFKKCKIIKQATSYSGFREGIWLLRRSADENLRQELGEEDGALISAMLLGEKAGLDEEDKNLYQRNGISHILAISGLHLMLLGMGIFKILKMIFGNRTGAVFSIIIMSIYCVFTGNSISTIRATVMFALSLTAGLFGRSYDSLSALGLAAIVQVFINPYVLNNSGFLLSFPAVIGVTFIAPKLQELLETKNKITKAVCVSLSSSIATLPVLLCNYGTYPWYSIFLNLCILPMMSVLLFLAAALTGLLLTAVGGELNVVSVVKNFIVMGIKVILNYFEICCKTFERAPFQDGYLGSPTVMQIILYVVLIVIVICGGIKHSKFASKMILLSAISILTTQIQVGTEFTMLDVGQGDGVVIRNRNGNVYISDCGSSSVSKVGKYRLIPFLKYKGYGKIKGIFVSHLDEDHLNGIWELLEMATEEKIEISYLFLPESVLWIKEDGDIVSELQELAKQNRAEVVYLKQGDCINDGAMKFQCLHPSGSKEQSRTEKDRNNQSLVLLMKYKEFEIMLTGDVEKAGELEFLEYADRMNARSDRSAEKETAEKETAEKKQDRILEDVDILKVAHHGSAGSSSEEFLQSVRPALSLISCGRNNSYGHPHEETVERLGNAGSRIMSTVDSGAITLKFGKKIRVYGFRE